MKIQLKHKVFGKAVQIPLHSFIEIEGRNAIKHCEVRIQHDFVASQKENGFLNSLRRHKRSHRRLTMPGHKLRLPHETPGNCIRLAAWRNARTGSDSLFILMKRWPDTLLRRPLSS